MRPDRLRPKSVPAKGADDSSSTRADAEEVEDNVAEDVPEPGKIKAPEARQDVQESANPAIGDLGNDDRTRKVALNSIVQEEDSRAIKVNARINESKEDCDPIERNVAVRELEENILPGADESIPNVSEEMSTAVACPDEELANTPTNREANLDSPSGARYKSRTVSISPNAVYDAEIREDGEDTFAIPVAPADDAEIYNEAIVTEVVFNYSYEHEYHGSTNAILIEGMDTEFSASELKDNPKTPESVRKGAATLTSPESVQERSRSVPKNTAVEAHSSELIDGGYTSPAGPKFSLAAQESAFIDKEDAMNVFSGTKHEDVISTEDNDTRLQPARNGAGDVILRDSPAIRKLRHSVRLSMEDLTPEEVTEAAIVFHNYTGKKESKPTIGSSPEGIMVDASRSPPKADLTVTLEDDTLEEPVEAVKGRTRSGARFSDDTTMLKDFLSRAQARKLAQPSGIPASAAKPLASPHRIPRKALAELDSNSPSTQKQRDIANRPGTPPGKGKLAAIDFEDFEEAIPEPTSCRRSTRTRSPAPSKSAPGAPSFIPVRRADGADPVILQKSAAQELAIVTRANTRRNKGQAKIPSVTLQSLPAEGSDLTAVKHGNKNAKSVEWDEKLVYFQEVTESTEIQEEKRPRVRRLRGLGGVNGTPAPQKMMADVNISYGTPAPKRRGKIR